MSRVLDSLDVEVLDLSKCATCLKPIADDANTVETLDSRTYQVEAVEHFDCAFPLTAGLRKRLRGHHVCVEAKPARSKR